MQVFQEITPVNVQKLHEEGGGLVVIDVRTPEEFQEVHAAIAKNLPLDTFDHSQVLALGLRPDEPVYVICRSGARSAEACQMLAAAGFAHPINVTGGTLLWEASGLPTSRKGG